WTLPRLHSLDRPHPDLFQRLVIQRSRIPLRHASVYHNVYLLVNWLITNGTEQEFGLNFSPESISANANGLSAIGRDSSGRVYLALIDADAKVRTLPFANPPKFKLRSALFSSNAKGEPILIDGANASFTTLIVDQDQVRESSPVSLTGPEFEYSRQRSQQVSGRLRMKIVLGHVSGSMNFLIGPYKTKEGYRLVQVDDEGQQINSYRLLTSGDGDPNLSPNPLFTNSTHFMLTAMDGTVRQYRRLQ
ncbi:MAG: hypothetical protein NW208_16905, partial [Bryobacter sp.]|nr:hypothetical protein [Bryobacter sp.]